MNQNSSAAKKQAILVFARDLSQELLHRKIPLQFSEFLKLPEIPERARQRADVHLFTNSICAEVSNEDIAIHQQQGKSFGEKLSHAIECIFNLGYEQVVIVGRDCPELEPEDIQQALEQLDHCRVIIGPDHRGGCYLIGFHLQDRNKLSRITWQSDTDCAQVLEIFESENAILLSAKHDIDSLADIQSLAKSDTRLGLIARTLLMLQETSVTFHLDRPSIYSSSNRHTQRQSWQLPPPR